MPLEANDISVSVRETVIRSDAATSTESALTTEPDTPRNSQEKRQNYRTIQNAGPE